MSDCKDCFIRAHIFAGDYGKLGHGSSTTQKYPKIIQGPLLRKVVRHISAGYRHSAAVTEEGELYTWGEGDYGRLGEWRMRGLKGEG